MAIFCVAIIHLLLLSAFESPLIVRAELVGNCPVDEYINLNQCQCNADQTEMSCLNGAITVEHLQEGIFLDLKRVTISGNYLPELKGNLFGDCNSDMGNSEFHYDDLEFIDMSNNKIVNIYGKAFHCIQTVKTLILDDNLIDFKISNSPAMFSNLLSLQSLSLQNAFAEYYSSSSLQLLEDLQSVFSTSYLSSLLVLNLSRNKLIYPIGTRKQFFCDLTSLGEINLSDNQFRSESLFGFLQNDCVPKTLYITHNAISGLEKSDINQLDRHGFKTFEMTDNPFSCDCDMPAMKSWLLSENSTYVFLRTMLKCKTPVELDGENIIEVPDKELKCIEANNGSHPGVVILWLLFIIIIIALIAAVYVKKDTIRKMISSASITSFKDSLLGGGMYTYKSVNTPENEVEPTEV